MTLTGAREIVIETPPGSEPDTVRAEPEVAPSRDEGELRPQPPSLDDVLERTEARRSIEIGERLSRLRDLNLDEQPKEKRLDALAHALLVWYGEDELLRIHRAPGTISLRLASDIARIDDLLGGMVNEILHHPEFQRLEASWRGLEWLNRTARQLNDEAKADETSDDLAGPPLLKLRVLNCSKEELRRDLGDALEFDQSHLFKEVYEQEYGMPGGTPYGLLIGDFDFSKHPDDIEMLEKVAEVAAAAHCPFVAAAAPDLLGLHDYAELERQPNLAELARGVERATPSWHALRKRDDSRYVGLVLPRVLMRLPYQDDGSRDDGFRFQEDLSSTRKDRQPYLWGFAIYAFASVVGRAFSRNGWLADIRGVRQDESGGGLVDNLPAHGFSTDRDAFKFSTNVAITDAQEREIAGFGVISLCPCHGTDLSAFYSVPSVQKPNVYAENASATTNARMSAMLHYILCASRFAHYLKVIMRDKVGGFTSPREIEGSLRDWLVEYVTSDDRADARTKARRPLRAADVKVNSMLDRPGHYDCKIFLQPHHQLDDLTGTIRLVSIMGDEAARR